MINNVSISQAIIVTEQKLTLNFIKAPSAFPLAIAIIVAFLVPVGLAILVWALRRKRSANLPTGTGAHPKSEVAHGHGQPSSEVSHEHATHIEEGKNAQ